MDTPEAQEAWTPDAPRAEHEWLRRLVGEWSYEMDDPQAGDGGKVVGTETVRALGDLWVLLEARGPMPGGGEAATLMTLGFDPKQERFVGTWVGSMMSWLFVYEGRLDGHQLALESWGPDMKTAGQTKRYKDVIEIVGDDHRTLTGNVLGDDGSWEPMMTVHYRRKG